MSAGAPRQSVLAIETATGDMSVALADEGGTLAEVIVYRQRRHAESLHPAITTVCEQSGMALGEVAAIAVDVGPGLFTGLRVGVTAAKTFAAVLDVPLVSVTSVEVLRRAALALLGDRDGDGDGDDRPEVVPVVDMRRGEVAWMIDDAVLRGSPEDLGAALAARRAARTFVVGDGALRHFGLIRSSYGEAGGRGGDGPRLLGSALSSPPAHALARLALERLVGGPSMFSDPVALVPLYLREADVAIGWDSREGRTA